MKRKGSKRGAIIPEPPIPIPESPVSTLGYQLSAVSFPIPESPVGCSNHLKKIVSKFGKLKAVSGQLVPTSVVR